MAAADPTGARVRLDGTFFRQGAAKFHLKGVAYGPFAPNAQGEFFASPERTARDFRQVRDLGANTVRVYHVPPRWFLDLAAAQSVQVLIDVPWPKHLCFLDSAPLRQEARKAVRQAVAAGKGHPAVLGYSVVNEIPPDVVRWSGTRRVEAFIDELVAEAKAEDPDCLCTFTNFPPTEYLHPQSIDFLSFNVYLHEPKAFENYLARLLMLADGKPLVLAEFGMDGLREGEARKSEFLSWQIEAAFRAGLAGTVVFSFTDDWFRGGCQIEDWAFGLTTQERQPKESFHAVQKLYAAAPYFPLPRFPKVSVVVASYNGGRTLNACLNSLARLNYPDYEVILVDDGSTDSTPEIARQHALRVRTIRQTNQGLSAARNAGIAAAQGEIVAFTDSDCRADEDWLYYLIGDLLWGDFVGIGGHNFLPPEDSPVAAAVMVSPGGPAHVMLTDREAEHIPGCNMAFYKWALEEIGGFDVAFRKAGDDVDVCWRLQQHGYRIGFSPAGFVWHYRRSTVKAYLRQQNGYGEAEALLARKHPEYFNSIGRSVWRGRIYSASKFGVILERSIIYHGIFGSGFFQKLYTPAPSFGLMMCTSLEYHLLLTVPLMVLSAAFSALWPLAIASLGISLAVCGVAAAQAKLPKSKRRFWSRHLVAALFFLQPVERGLARYKTRLYSRPRLQPQKEIGFAQSPFACEPDAVLDYWSKGDVDRYALLSRLQERLEEEQYHVRPDVGWSDHDFEIMGHRWSRVRLTTVTEELEQGKKNLRVRLESRWSLLAKFLFWALLGAELLIVGLVSQVQPWIWMLPLSLPFVSWYLEYEQLNLRLALAELIDGVAARLALIRLQQPQEKAGAKPEAANRQPRAVAASD